MATTLQKWGNSFGIRVPKAIAKQVHIKEGAKFDVEIKDGRVTFVQLTTAKPRRRSKYKISDLLASYKGPYPHRGVFNDPPVGKELI